MQAATGHGVPGGGLGEPFDRDIVKQPTAYDELGFVDASGVVYMADQLSGGLNCSQWLGGYLRQGLVLEPSGVFGTRFCDSSLAIACCSSLTR